MGAAMTGALVTAAVRANSTLLVPVRSGEPSVLESIKSPGEAMGLELTDVDVCGELGNLPAWRISAPPEGASATWAILVHGQGGDRRDCLGPVAALHALGVTQLVISWRNDGVAGPSPDGLYHLGDTEWRDLEAAVEWALRQGAVRLILYGFSMGGSIVGVFLRRSPHARMVVALVLDAPVLDWRAVLRHGARRRYVPAVLARITTPVAQHRVGVDFDELDWLRARPSEHPDVFELPTLILHGTKDQLVPLATSRRYAGAHPELTTLIEVTGAGHGQLWRVEPVLCNEALRSFMLAAS